MKYVVYISYKYPNNLYRNVYSLRFKIIAWIKALWDTRFHWEYFNYNIEK